MALDQVGTAIPYRRLTVLIVCVLLVSVCLTWTYLGMRAVMAVGGSCAEGGPYVIAQPCPGGVWMLSVGVPVMILAAFAGTIAAVSVSAPDLLLPMWVLTFGSLGWNFLDYGLFTDDLVWGWIICGVMFELMALPVVYLALPIGKRSWKPPKVVDPAATLGGWWWGVYLLLGVVGAVLAVWSYGAWSQ